MTKFRELTWQGEKLARELVSHDPRYGVQISLPAGFTFETLLSEMEKPSGRRRIEFFEVLFGGKIAGFCYYTMYERSRSAELAAIYLPRYRGRGLSSGTIAFLIDHATRSYPRLLRVEATASSSNPAAVLALLSAGLKVEGILPSAYVRGEMISDAVLLGLVLKRPGARQDSLYRIESFKDKELERNRLLKQGELLLGHEADLIRASGLLEKFAAAGVIVDVGCGFGQFAAWLSATFPRTEQIVGVDPSAWMIKGSEAKGLRNVKLVCADGLGFLEGLPEGRAGAVCFRFVINHIPETLWGRWLAAAYRCLKPGGIVYLALADANYYKTHPRLPLMDLVFEHKRLLREKNGGIWNAPSVIGGYLHAAGFKNIAQKSACLSSETMGRKNFAVSVGDMFVWGVEESWGRTGELARKKLLAAAGKKGFWGQVKVGVHAGEKV